MIASNKRAERLKESHGLRAKAPVAAQFEDCVQAAQQLSDSLRVNQSSSRLRSMSNDCELRLKIWGDDSGASSRALDYALRNSPVVKQQTLSLLEDLHSVLEQVIDGVRPQEPDDPDDSVNPDDEHTEPTVDPIAVSASPSLQPANLTYSEGGTDDQDAEYDSVLYLEEAVHVIGYLVRLLPALRAPPQEDATADIHDNDEYFEESYRRLAAMIFPKAPKRLVQRLGCSNWRRRRNIRSSPDGMGVPYSQTLPKRPPFKSSLTPWDRHLRQAGKPYKGYSEQPWTIAESETEADSTIVSNVDTLLTKIPLVDQDSLTSTTETSHPSSVLQLLVLPQPPVALATVEQFDCPYCHFELPLAFSSERIGLREWTTHVYHDLKPYMCTFDGCFYEHQLYGDKDEWFQHELDFHRSRFVWSCSMCRADFETTGQLETHLESHHTGLSSTQLDLARENCKRFSEGLSLPDQPCTLCGRVFDSAYELEDHLGNHLESFALAALLDDEPPEEEGLQSEEVIADYFAGLPTEEGREVKLPGAEDETYPDTLLNAAPGGRDVSHAADISSSTGHDDLENDTKRKPSGNDWTEKVESFLDKQTTQDSFSRVLYNVRPRYDNFVGRDVDLQSIHESLSKPGRICTVSGRGGIGKTATAIEYLYKYESEYSYVFWVDAETPGLCAERYGGISNSLNLAEKSLVDEDARIYLVRDCLFKSERRWLLIFDNVVSWTDISKYIPRNLARTKGSILVTTRSAPLLSIPPRHPVAHHQHPVELDVWPLDHGREFLLTSIQPSLKKEDLQAHNEYEYASQVVEVVGLLPLAISMIVGYVKVSRCTLSDFLEMWEEKEFIDRKKKKRFNEEGSDVDATIDSLWTIGIREVRMNSRHLLNILAFLDPETIQKSLLVGDHKEEYLEFLNSSETLSYKRMINELSGRRLLEFKDTTSGEPAYNIHRLLQQKILEDMESFTFSDAFRKAFRLIRKRFPAADPQQVPSPGEWDTCQEYRAHISAFYGVYNRNAHLLSLVDPQPTELATLFYDAAFYMWAYQSSSHDGLPYLETAERILDDIKMDQNAKIRADILCLTGLLLSNMGCIERAQGVNRLMQAWQIRKRVYEEHHTRDNDVLLQNSANDYSICLLNEHQFRRAGQMFKECRERYRIWGPESENPFETSKYYGNYSVVLMFKGKMSKAIRYQEKALRLIEKFSGKKWWYYRREYNLACLLLQAGDIQGALDKHLEILNARLELNGKLHEYTILSTFTVGAMYHHLGDLDTAIDYIQQCIESAKISKWDAAAFTRAKCLLALLYREQGIEEDAVAELEKDVTQFLNEYGHYAAECVRGVDDKMMILDDLQPSLVGRYTGRALLKHLQKHLQY